MGSQQSQPVLYPTTQYFLPIFGHPADVGSIRLMGDYVVTDTHLFGCHIITPVSKRIAKGLDNDELWRRFGCVDLDFEQFKSVLDQNKSLHALVVGGNGCDNNDITDSTRSTCFENYGAGMSHTDATIPQQGLQDIVRMMEFENKSADEQWQEDPQCVRRNFLNRALNSPNRYGQPYWRFDKPTKDGYWKLLRRCGLEMERAVVKHMSLAETGDDPRRFPALLINDACSGQSHGYHNAGPILFNGRLSIVNPNVESFSRLDFNAQPIVVKRVCIDVMHTATNTTVSPMSTTSTILTPVHFYKISVPQLKCYDVAPMIYQLDLSIAFDGLVAGLPSSHQWSAQQRAAVADKPIGYWYSKFIKDNYVANPLAPIMAAAMKQDSNQSSQGTELKNLLTQFLGSSSPSSIDNVTGNSKAKAAAAEQKKQSIQRDANTTTTTISPDPVCIAVRPCYGLRGFPLGGFGKDELPICTAAAGGGVTKDMFEPSKTVYPISPSSSVGTQIAPAIAKINKHLGTVLIIDVKNGGEEVLQDFVTQMQGLRMAGGDNADSAAIASTNMPTGTVDDETNAKQISFDFFAAPLHIIIVAPQLSAALDTETLTSADVMKRVNQLGFNTVTLITVTPSPTRHLDNWDKNDTAVLGHLLHNGALVKTEPLMNKLEWDGFVRPIWDQLYKLQFARIGAD